MTSDASDLSMREKLLANAQLFADYAHEEFGTPLTFDGTGALWLDQHIRTIRANVSPKTKERLPDTFGAFLGECIRQTYGGQWVLDHSTGSWGVEINKDVIVFPISKVAKHLSGGDSDSVYGLFTAIPAMLSQEKRAQSPLERRVWWKFWER